MNVKFDETYLEELATLFIPDDKKEQLLSKIEKYIDIQHLPKEYYLIEKRLLVMTNYLPLVEHLTHGWWKNLKRKQKYNEKLRYSLILSIETPENVAEIYTSIAQKVNVENLIKI